MTKAERKLLQQKEAVLYLELQQYRNWFGKEDRLTKLASSAWCASYEILELLDIEVDHNLPAAKEAQALMSEIVEKEEREKELINQ
tara:strand:- start:565 stop:822 length:258 start_codon:yes stop_codon:yes gene_type:complete